MSRVRAIVRGGRRVLQRFDGAGDVVETLVRVGTLGLARPCAGCVERKDWANRVLPNPFKGDRPWRS